MLLRVAVPGDKPAIERVLDAAFGEPLRGAYSESLLAAAVPAMTKANPALLSCGTFYVVENGDGCVVGCGGWTPERPGTTEIAAGLGHIRHFATHPEWIGRGIGRLIYRHCEERAREAGVKRLECYSTLNAEPFYAAMGFQRVSVNEVMLAGGIPFPSVIMRRSLEP